MRKSLKATQRKKKLLYKKKAKAAWKKASRITIRKTKKITRKWKVGKGVYRTAKTDIAKKAISKAKKVIKTKVDPKKNPSVKTTPMSDKTSEKKNNRSTESRKTKKNKKLKKIKKITKL